MWRWLNRSPGQASARLEFFQNELSAATALVIDIPALQILLASHFRKMTGAPAVLFCAYDTQRNAYASAAASGPEAEPHRAVVLRADGNLVQWLEVNETYLLIPDDAGVFQHLTLDEQQSLRDLGVRVCLPLLIAGHAVGLLLLVDGSRRWRVPLDELSLWLRCAQRAALACEAAERRRLEYARLRTRHQAQQLVVAGQLAAAVAHEVRNPLSTIRSTIQYVMSSESAWDGKRELLHDALTEIDRIEHSVSGMLSLSRPRELALVDLDLTDVARDSLRLVQAYAEAQRVTIQTEFIQPIPVVGDLRELRQVFVNLLLNACQAMPAGGVIVASSALAESPDDDGTAPQRFGVIRIADNGPGIPEAQREKVFDPFFTTKTSGTGLGLPICLEIVSRNGGRLTLGCPPEGGTVASVWLPVRVG